jgi:ABC-type iron transport system FetAB ATPase subunit
LLKVEKLKVGTLPPLSFEVAAGECLAVEGPSGSGKTRLLRAIADLDAADGYVYLEGAERAEIPAPQWRRRVRYVAAEPAWWSQTPRAHWRGNEAAAPRLERLLASVGLAVSLLDRPIWDLSTGERLRLGLVRALLDEPMVLLLDEPTSALDTQATALVDELIRFQLLAGRSALLVSHNPVEIAQLAHQRLLLGAPSTEHRAVLPDQPFLIRTGGAQ